MRLRCIPSSMNAMSVRISSITISLLTCDLALARQKHAPTSIQAIRQRSSRAFDVYRRRTLWEIIGEFNFEIQCADKLLTDA